MRDATRGIVWLVVGIAAQLIGWLAGHPLLLRGTRIPVGILVAALGLLLLAWDTRGRWKKN